MSGAAVAGGLAVGIAFVVMFSMFVFPPGYSGDISDVEISLERTVCFGFCPDYTVTVFGDGTVVYEGRNYVAVEGEQRGQISKEDVRELVNEFYQVGFFNFDDAYTDSVTDLPSQTTSITIDGETKSVFRYGSKPPKLIILEDKIDEIAQTEKWVKE
ncbi:DUF6438 domain-containing protein [Candidatus Nitrososphaera sp. FF02]|uniref:DUF6438 domain-containing protein n=1 Tax=Candidatus Nitrososphaera sp. FF02 TaxID=3398226 RepID=UPI0039EA146D